MRIPKFKLERYFAKYEFNTPYLLSSSDCESFTIEELLRFDTTATEAFMNIKLSYTESLGNEELRHEISKLYTTVDIDNIIVFTGAEEGIFAFMNSVLEEGDEIIVQFPGYQSLYEIAEAIGAKVIRWEMQEDDAWNLDVSFLEDNITDKTKAIVINNPHNPTGQILSHEEYQNIIDLVRKYDLYLFSDEVYRFTEFDQSKALAPAVDLYEKSLSLGVMSKSFGLPGLRIGWIATHDSIIFDKIASFKDYTTICNSAPSEFLATIALKHKEVILTKIRDLINTNMSTLDDFFQQYADFVSWVRPLGGSIGFVRLNQSKFPSAENFSIDLINSKGVLLVPGPIFDYGDNYFRIGYGRANMIDSLNQLRSYFDNLSPR